MNYDLAVMALDGIARAPLSVNRNGDEVLIEASPATFKELARLCLLLGTEGTADGEAFELEPGAHTARGSATLRLRLKKV